ncbi:IS30 family transposase [Brevibacterium sp. S111]|uniref:IS30 family transposase n=1 Tax=Brevibacterium sp. S111 TaxID=2483795 RepID=UPI001081B3AF|nr:IS30 family transposase [Brevibacterium sp. S111]TGD11633.1 IS30 family transposase [Brevibacterium sp. S111]
MARVWLSFSDRSEISTASKAGWSVRRIARHLGRCPSLISRELHRNSTKTRGYQAVTADVRAQRRRARPQQRKVALDPVLQARVDADLAASWTPNEIAGRLRLEAADPTVERMANSPDARGRTVSGEAIYQYIYAMPRGELARRGIFLQSKRTTRRPRTTGWSRGGPIVGMVPLADRGEDAAERRVPGHWEGDLIIGKNGTSCAATLVERMSGFTGLLALPSKHAGRTADAVIEYFNALPEMMKASLAWDQGSEMAQHAKVSLATTMPVYFADPHSPWQRPSNENTNRLYREYLPKGTEIPDHQPYLTTIAEEINNRPRRRLGFLTPTESFARLLANEPHVASTH